MWANTIVLSIDTSGLPDIENNKTTSSYSQHNRNIHPLLPQQHHPHAAKRPNQPTHDATVAAGGGGAWEKRRKQSGRILRVHPTRTISAYTTARSHKTEPHVQNNWNKGYQPTEGIRGRPIFAVTPRKIDDHLARCPRRFVLRQIWLHFFSSRRSSCSFSSLACRTSWIVG